MYVKELFCYPVKSCRGISLSSAFVDQRGFQYDRRWMIVNEEGMFVSQRAGTKGRGVGVKRLCLIETAFEGENLVLRNPMSEFSLPLGGLGGDLRFVRIWNDDVLAVDQGDEVAEWLSNFLSHERPDNYRLVRMPEREVRHAHTGNSEVAFADGYPFLMISQASLDDLNSRLKVPVPMDRFRPNIVLDGCEPYAEDALEKFWIGSTEFTAAKPCVRCAIITTDQATAQRGTEPLATLATYRRTEEGVVFGMNFGHRGNGRIRVGDAIEIL
jgi:uncharacterized protein YcbX